MAFTSAGSYQFIKCVCVGSMTQLWQGYSSLLEIPVAIKMPVEDLKRDRRVIDALRKEYVIGREIHHAKIVEMYDFLQEKGETFLVMEWVPFLPLRDVLSEGVETYGWRVHKIVEDMAEALACFNSYGWVHRDLSPDVFMVNPETNDTRLIEFLFAQRPNHLWSRLLGSDEVPQRGRYLVPEQIRGEGRDQRSDIYSLACIWFEMATGVPPFAGENFNQLAHQHLNVPVPAADGINPNLTEEFTKLLRQCMAKSPSERPSSTHEVYNALKEMKIFIKTPEKRGTK